jgi:hypothetical protein
VALSYTGTGGLYARVADICSELNRVVSGYGTNLNAGVDAIWDDYPNSNSDGLAVDGLLSARDSYRGVHGSYLNSLATALKNTIVYQVDRQVGPISSRTLSTALTELKAAMVTDIQTIQRPTTTATVTAGGTNVGNGVVKASLTNAFGDPLDLTLAETTKFTVAVGGTAYAESMTFTGQPAVAASDYRWPQGSGCSGSINFTDATTAGLLTDGSFESWSLTVPTYWTTTVGAATVDKSTSNTVGRGTYTMKWTSDGSTLTTVRQQLSSSVTANSVLCLNLWAMMSSADASGVIRFRLTNSAGTTLTDDAGTSLSYTRNTNGQIGTSLTNISTFFSLPRYLPTTGGVWLEIGVTTAYANAKILYLDHLSLVAATQTYPGGPYVAAFSKDTAAAARDTYSLVTTNSLDHRSFVRSLDRWCDMRSAALYLPTSGSPSITDSIT